MHVCATHGILGLSVSPYGWQGVVLMQALFFAAIGLTLVLAYTGETPFIYAQF